MLTRVRCAIASALTTDPVTKYRIQHGEGALTRAEGLCVSEERQRVTLKL